MLADGDTMCAGRGDGDNGVFCGAEGPRLRPLPSTLPPPRVRLDIIQSMTAHRERTGGEGWRMAGRNPAVQPMRSRLANHMNGQRSSMKFRYGIKLVENNTTSRMLYSSMSLTSHKQLHAA